MWELWLSFLLFYRWTRYNMYLTLLAKGFSFQKWTVSFMHSYICRFCTFYWEELMELSLFYMHVLDRVHYQSTAIGGFSCQWWMDCPYPILPSHLERLDLASTQLCMYSTRVYPHCDLNLCRGIYLLHQTSTTNQHFSEEFSTVWQLTERTLSVVT